MKRTSKTHPLRIDSVPCAKGEIGMTLCPGKVQKNAQSGEWKRDLDTDIAAIKEWGAVAVVTFNEAHELKELKVPDLGSRIEQADMEWYHLPIQDGGAPDDQFRNLWAYAGHRLRKHLAEGLKILLHCKGGLGRTGTVAAFLLCEFRDHPAKAISQIREARGGAIENSEQERAIWTFQPREFEPEFASKALGCLFGGAVGDAIGYPIEFHSMKEIRAIHGRSGLRKLPLSKGKLTVSDDTQMTLFTTEGLLRGLKKRRPLNTVTYVDKWRSDNFIAGEIKQAYLDWLVTQGSSGRLTFQVGTLHSYPELNARRAPGNTCIEALTREIKSRYREVDEAVFTRAHNNSKGCGGVMRVAPIGLVREWTQEQCLKLASDAAAITHGHRTGILSAGAMGAIVRCLIDGWDLRNAAEVVLEVIDNGLGFKEELDETVKAIESALKLAEKAGKTPRLIKKLGQGWVAEEALAIGLFAALKAESFEDALFIAANHDGDSDSTASIAGQLYGAWKGVEGLPHEWVRHLDVLNPLAEMTKGLIEYCPREELIELERVRQSRDHYESKYQSCKDFADKCRMWIPEWKKKSDATGKLDEAIKAANLELTDRNTFLEERLDQMEQLVGFKTKDWKGVFGEKRYVRGVPDEPYFRIVINFAPSGEIGPHHDMRRHMKAMKNSLMQSLGGERIFSIYFEARTPAADKATKAFDGLWQRLNLHKEDGNAEALEGIVGLTTPSKKL